MLQKTRLEEATQLPSFYAEDTPMAANETWARLHADPLFAMKQQELSARKAVIKNPVMMADIKAKVLLLIPPHARVLLGSFGVHHHNFTCCAKPCSSVSNLELQQKICKLYRL